MKFCPNAQDNFLCVYIFTCYLVKDQNIDNLVWLLGIIGPWMEWTYSLASRALFDVWAALMKSAPLSPIIMQGAFVFPDVKWGIIDASMTRRPWIPRTLKWQEGKTNKTLAAIIMDNFTSLWTSMIMSQCSNKFNLWQKYTNPFWCSWSYMFFLIIDTYHLSCGILDTSIQQNPREAPISRRHIFPDFSIIFLCHQSVDIHIRILNPKY